MTTDYQKHSVSTDALDTLGTIIGPDEKRDAIHLAVFPVEAAHQLRPGWHVGLDEDGRASTSTPPRLGIVDPFLLDDIQPGERFWLVVYPRQITSLRHVWEHPDFPPSGETEAVSPSERMPGETPEEAERWLRDWLDTQGGNPGFDAVMSVIKDGSWSSGHPDDWDISGHMSDWGPYIHFSGTDAHGEIPAEFWDHVEVYLGRKIAEDDRAEGFSCSC